MCVFVCIMSMPYFLTVLPPAAASACFLARAASCLARMMAASLTIPNDHYYNARISLVPTLVHLPLLLLIDGLSVQTRLALLFLFLLLQVLCTSLFSLITTCLMIEKKTA